MIVKVTVITGRNLLLYPISTRNESTPASTQACCALTLLGRKRHRMSQSTTAFAKVPPTLYCLHSPLSVILTPYGYAKVDDLGLVASCRRRKRQWERRRRLCWWNRWRIGPASSQRGLTDEPSMFLMVCLWLVHPSPSFKPPMALRTGQRMIWLLHAADEGNGNGESGGGGAGGGTSGGGGSGPPPNGD